MLFYRLPHIICSCRGELYKLTYRSIAKIQEELESAKSAHAAADDKVVQLQEANAQLSEQESSREAQAAARQSELEE